MKFKIGDYVTIDECVSRLGGEISVVSDVNDKDKMYKLEDYNGIWYHESLLKKATFGDIIKINHTDYYKEFLNHCFMVKERRVSNPIVQRKLLPKKVLFDEKKKSVTLLYKSDSEKQKYRSVSVKTTEGDEYDKEKGFLIAFFQEATGMSKTKYHEYMNKTLKREER